MIELTVEQQQSVARQGETLPNAAAQMKRSNISSQ